MSPAQESMKSLRTEKSWEDLAWEKLLVNSPFSTIVKEQLLLKVSYFLSINIDSLTATSAEAPRNKNVFVLLLVVKNVYFKA